MNAAQMPLNNVKNSVTTAAFPRTYCLIENKRSLIYFLIEHINTSTTIDIFRDYMGSNKQTLIPCCKCKCSSEQPKQTSNTKLSNEQKNNFWNVRYSIIIPILVLLWLVIYHHTLPAAPWITYELFGLTKESHLGASVEFFIYDTIKILILLIAMIYAVACLRASFDTERIRRFLVGKRRGVGYLFGSLFGSITPFCSCSSIPLFLGFTTARIPIGITMAFLITSPLINEIAIILLWGLLGWKFTIIYVTLGISAGIIGGYFMDAIKAERWLQPFLQETGDKNPASLTSDKSAQVQKMTLKQRHDFAYNETAIIFKRVWKWVIVGVGAGAALHGFVPQDWFAQNLGSGEWWSVPVAVFAAIPLYSNVTGIIPVMESLLLKGLPIGTTLAFCMSAVAASLPEMIMLRQIMQLKLQVAFIGYLWLIFTLAGWVFNILGPYIF